MALPTVVVIPGAASPAVYYGKLLKRFEEKGYSTLCLDPPSITAEDATSVTVDTDTTFVREEVLHPLLADGKDIILLVHSYGGAYGAAAARGLSKRERTSNQLSGGIVGVFYVGSFCTDPGQSALEGMANPNAADLVIPSSKTGAVTFATAESMWPSLAEKDRAAWYDKAKPTAALAVMTPVSYAPYRDSNYDGKIAYIYLEDDVYIPLNASLQNIEKSGIKATRKLPGGHGIGLESTKEIVDAVLEIQEEFS